MSNSLKRIATTALVALCLSAFAMSASAQSASAAPDCYSKKQLNDIQAKADEAARKARDEEFAKIGANNSPGPDWEKVATAQARARQVRSAIRNALKRGDYVKKSDLKDYVTDEELGKALEPIAKAVGVLKGTVKDHEERIGTNEQIVDAHSQQLAIDGKGIADAKATAARAEAKAEKPAAFYVGAGWLSGFRSPSVPAAMAGITELRLGTFLRAGPGVLVDIGLHAGVGSDMAGVMHPKVVGLEVNGLFGFRSGFSFAAGLNVAWAHPLTLSDGPYTVLGLRGGLDWAMPGWFDGLHVGAGASMVSAAGETMPLFDVRAVFAF